MKVRLCMNSCLEFSCSNWLTILGRVRNKSCVYVGTVNGLGQYNMMNNLSQMFS